MLARFSPSLPTHTLLLDALAASGIIANRTYAHMFCSPTRCAIQSGRAPIHVNAINAGTDVWNPADPEGGAQGIPRNMTCIASKMKEAGYATLFFGTLLARV